MGKGGGPEMLVEGKVRLLLRCDSCGVGSAAVDATEISFG